MKSESALQTAKSPGVADGDFQAGKILALSIAHFVHDVYSSFLSPLLPLLIEKLSMSLTQAGFLTTVMQIPALLNPYIGVLADRISVRYFVILAPAMTAVPMSLIGMAPSYGVLLILLFVTGISVSLFHVPSPVMVADLSAARKGRGMSFYMTGGELARTVGPLVAVAAVSLFGLEDFYPVMIFGLLSSVWLYFKFRKVPVKSAGSHRRLSILETWRSTRHVLLPLTAILIARGFMHASLTAFLPTYIKMETGNLWLAGIALTLFEAAGVAGVLTAGSVSDRFGRRKTLLGLPAGSTAFPVPFHLDRRRAAPGRPACCRFHPVVNHPGNAGPGPGKCPAQPGGGQRAVYDDLFYGPIGSGGGGRNHCRPHRFECRLFDQRRHGADRHTVCFEATQVIKKNS